MWVCGRLLTGIVGSNPAMDMDVSLSLSLSLLSVVFLHNKPKAAMHSVHKLTALSRSVVCCQAERRADHSSRGVLPIMVCLSATMNSG